MTQPFEAPKEEYRGHHLRARRLDTKEPNRWEAQIDKQAVGRARSSSGALELARRRVDQHYTSEN